MQTHRIKGQVAVTPRGDAKLILVTAFFFDAYILDLFLLRYLFLRILYDGTFNILQICS